MNRKNTIIKNINMSSILPRFVANWMVFITVVICLTTIPVWSDDPPESEKKDAEVVKETEKKPEVAEKETENNSSKNTDKTSSDTDEEAVIVSKEVITGTSDEMERYEKAGITILIGNAKTKRHTEDGVEIGFLNADKITLKSDPETGQTIEIIAEGNVEIRDNTIFATCDHATMDNKTHIIVLKENVVVLQKEDRLETKLFTFNRITGKQTGVGGVKFKVAVTQTTPVSTEEESEGNGTDSEGTTDTSDNTEKKETSPDTDTKVEKESKSDSDKPDAEVKTAKPDTEDKEEESKENKETEPAESEETEPAESEETEPAESEETDDETSPEEEQ